MSVAVPYPVEIVELDGTNKPVHSVTGSFIASVVSCLSGTGVWSPTVSGLDDKNGVSRCESVLKAGPCPDSIAGNMFNIEMKMIKRVSLCDIPRLQRLIISLHDQNSRSGLPVILRLLLKKVLTKVKLPKIGM